MYHLRTLPVAAVNYICLLSERNLIHRCLSLEPPCPPLALRVCSQARVRSWKGTQGCPGTGTGIYQIVIIYYIELLLFLHIEGFHAPVTLWPLECCSLMPNQTHGHTNRLLHRDILDSCISGVSVVISKYKSRKLTERRKPCELLEGIGAHSRHTNISLERCLTFTNVFERVSKSNN